MTAPVSFRKKSDSFPLHRGRRPYMTRSGLWHPKFAVPHNAADLVACSPRTEARPMRRREFITVLGGTLAWPLAARGQQAEQVRRIGVLMARREDDPDEQARLSAFLQGLQESGWSDGRNVRIDV